MNLVLPPLFFYGISVLLIVLGALRAFHLGWKNKPRRSPSAAPRPRAARRSDGEPASGGTLEAGEVVEEDFEDEELDEDELAAEKTQNKNANRHIKFGLLWIGMGLFLLISTVVKSR